MIGGDLTVGAIGYGAMQLTGPKVWGEYPDHDKAIALLREVVAQGVTYIDTADVYGPHSNEELIREALHPYPDNLVIATKGGFVRGGPEYSDMSAVGNKQYLRQAAHMSMILGIVPIPASTVGWSSSSTARPIARAALYQARAVAASPFSAWIVTSSVLGAAAS